jgi:hypothetical protein
MPDLDCRRRSNDDLMAWRVLQVSPWRRCPEGKKGTGLACSLKHWRVKEFCILLKKSDATGKVDRGIVVKLT